MNRKQRIAVVGAGISGLASAWLLSRRYDVTLFEAGSYLGGHTNTVDVTLEGKTHPVDTGFLVFNQKTYPNLIAMFAELGVDSVATEMSFAVSLENPDLEWAGSNLATVFGQKRNLLRPSFWAMLRDKMLAAVQGQGGIWLAGAWGSYGFHEDGLNSALRVANGMGIRAPWQAEHPSLVRQLEAA